VKLRIDRRDPEVFSRGSLAGSAFLIVGLALGAIYEALENQRTIPDSNENTRRNRQIVAYEIEFRELRLMLRKETFMTTFLWMK
jgi:hypothetical protein